MSTREDGQPAGPPARRWRLDDQSPTRPPDGTSPRSHARASGRRTVLAIVAVVLTLWLGFDLAFRGWKARYLARAEFGASRVAPAVDPLASDPPADLDPTAWRSAVADTHAMLLALTGSGVLDESQMDDLRREVAARVAVARPGTARKVLAELWDDLERKAGPVIAPDRVPPLPAPAMPPGTPARPGPRSSAPPRSGAETSLSPNPKRTQTAVGPTNCPKLSKSPLLDPGSTETSPIKRTHREPPRKTKPLHLRPPKRTQRIETSMIRQGAKFA